MTDFTVTGSTYTLGCCEEESMGGKYAAPESSQGEWLIFLHPLCLPSGDC